MDPQNFSCGLWCKMSRLWSFPYKDLSDGPKLHPGCSLIFLVGLELAEHGVSGAFSTGTCNWVIAELSGSNWTSSCLI